METFLLNLWNIVGISSAIVLFMVLIILYKQRKNKRVLKPLPRPSRVPYNSETFRRK